MEKIGKYRPFKDATLINTYFSSRFRAMQLALFQPDQPPNTGTLLRLGACMNMPVHVIEPCGFPFSPKAVKRYAMDYADHVDLHHHLDWQAFEAWRADNSSRLVLLTTQTTVSFTKFEFEPSDILMVGSESSGAPKFVHETADARVTIPMNPAVRSLNVAVAAAMVMGEALRQTNQYPA